MTSSQRSGGVGVEGAFDYFDMLVTLAEMAWGLLSSVPSRDAAAYWRSIAVAFVVLFEEGM